MLFFKWTHVLGHYYFWCKEINYRFRIDWYQKEEEEEEEEEDDDDDDEDDDDDDDDDGDDENDEEDSGGDEIKIALSGNKYK